MSGHLPTRAALAAAAGLLALAVLGGCAQQPPYRAEADQVAVTGGLVAAAADSTAAVRVFKAIPFAAPPVGALRWRAPQPPAAWAGVRRQDAFGAACLMGNRPAGQPGAILYQPAPAQSEDCLTLNVWAPARSAEPAPVFVLLHGGGYLLGSGAQPNYDGSGLAAKGAVVVTLNYRLGALGFLAHPALSAESPDRASGNYALLDALAALRWVKANAAAFGGDPARVTLLSESAGSGMASALWASPLAQGLFDRIVIESLAALPAGAETPTLAVAEQAGVRLAQSLGIADLAGLRAAAGAALMAAPGALVGPIVDGHVLPDALDRRILAGAVVPVPMLVGWNADEATPYPPFATDLAGYTAAAKARYGALADRFRQTYPVASDAEVQALAFAPLRDGFFAWQPWTLARAHAAWAARAGQPAGTYVYHFSRRPAYLPGQKFKELDPPERYGAHHSLEQVYFYDNLLRSVPPRAFDATDHRLADTASDYLLQFARSGNPNRPGLPDWQALDLRAPRVMELGDRIGMAPVPQAAALAFFDDFHAGALGRPLPIGPMAPGAPIAPRTGLPQGAVR